MKWWHWLLIILVVAIRAVETVISGNPGLPRQFVWILGLELAYFVLLAVLGVSFGRLMQARLLAREDKEEYERSASRYQLLGWLFVLASITYLLTGWLPGWIGRNIILLGGYYLGLGRMKRSE